MKINDSDIKEDTGRIHVDYAQARDDQFEFECQQRALARKMRHLQRIDEERNRPPSPPPVLHYADHEASLLLEKLKCTYKSQQMVSSDSTLFFIQFDQVCNKAPPR